VHGVGGWVRNAPDGSVEAVFEGEDAAVEAMTAWCRHGPPQARVDAVDVVSEAPEGLSGFVISG
jgi:acylphosphatase